MDTATEPVMALARLALRTGHRVTLTLFFNRVVDRMKRSGPIEDLDAEVKLATRGFWHAITPIQNPREILALLRSSNKRARSAFSGSGPLAAGPCSSSPGSPRRMPSW
jgi:hypothetical protein